MGYLATETAANAAIIYMRDGIRAKRIGIGFNGQRWAARKPDTGVIPRADLIVDAEPGRLNTNSTLQFPGIVCFEAALAREHALPIRNDDLQPVKVCGHGIPESIHHHIYAVGADGF